MRMRRSPKVTFLGPILTANDGSGASFLLVQGGSAIRLDYKSTFAARQAKKELCEGPMTYRIQNVKLLDAIRLALADALADALVESQPADIGDQSDNDPNPPADVGASGTDLAPS